MYQEDVLWPVLFMNSRPIRTEQSVDEHFCEEWVSDEHNWRGVGLGIGLKII